MKKLTLTTILMCAACIAQAQLRVTANGNVSLQSAETPLSVLSIGSEGVDDYFLSTKGTKQGVISIVNGGQNKWRQGGTFISYTNFGDKFNVGLSGSANASDNKDGTAGRAFGVMGIAGNATSGWNYGIFGRLTGGNYGSAVYGTIYKAENGIYLDDRYAGFFNGPVKVNGDLTINGTLEGVALGEAAENVVSENSVSVQTADKAVANTLVGLTAVPYFKTSDKAVATMVQAIGDTLSGNSQINTIEVQNITKKHYSLSAEQLEYAYPDLVYTKEDGTKVINYMEMIPLLVQSIGELTEKINALENEKKAMKAVAHNNVTEISNAEMTKTSLSQNIPNPFDYATSIAVTIPETVKDTYLLVCDMTGKQIKKIAVTERGTTNVKFTSDGLEAGMYLYSLIVEKQLVDTKRMIVTK